MVSRRRVLAGASLGTLASIAGCLGSSPLADGPDVSTWSPAENTWPLPWYDPANTKYNPHAEPPRSSVERTNRIDIGTWWPPLVVSEDFVAVSGADGGVFHRDDLSRLWGQDERVRAAAFAPPPAETDDGQRLYVATSDAPRENSTIRGLTLDGDDVKVDFETEVSDRSVRSIIAAESHVYVSETSGDAILLDATGEETWETVGVYGAVGDEQVIAELGTGTVTRIETNPDGLLRSGPEKDWTTSEPLIGTAHRPVIADGTVFIGYYDTFPTIDGSLHAFDIEDGDRRWEPISYGADTSSPAVADGICYVAGHNRSDDAPPDGHICALDAEDGSEIWTENVDWYPRAPVATGNGLVLVPDETFGTDVGYLAAYDTDTGEQQWTYEAAGPIRSVCPVGEQIYVGTDESLDVLG